MKKQEHACRLMGSNFELGVVSNPTVSAKRILEKGVQEIKRIESLLSEFRKDSLTSKINKNAGKEPVVLPSEVFQLLQRCCSLHKISNGFFDITVGPLKALYQFNNTAFEMPQATEVSKAMQKVGTQHMVLNPEEQSVFLPLPGMKISFAGIGKGYAADRVKKLWQSEGINNGYINASGDLCAFGNNSDGNAWKIGIAHPDDRSKNMFFVPISGSAAATSGDYEQHFFYKGKRYSHNINPKNGLPLTGIKSVSVFSPSAELSDALATAVYAMGAKKGMALLEQLPQTHAILLDDQNNFEFTNGLRYEHID